MGRTVAVAMVVIGVLANGASTAEHCCLCWPDVQCEMNPGVHPYSIALNRLAY